MREHTHASLRPLAWCGPLLIAGSVLLAPARAGAGVEPARGVRTSAYVLRGFRWNGQVVRVAIVTATGDRGIRFSMAGERFGERRTTSAIGT
ncbi:MAG TPA: hypothetical protein VNO17_12280, partial [Actinomycetota bacterium]|nr:hypothetical protein [Actinomycetota bacterium]